MATSEAVKWKPPGRGAVVATPVDQTMIDMIGAGARFEDTTFTRDQWGQLRRFYGYIDEPVGQVQDDRRRSELNVLKPAIESRDLGRLVSRDGRRVMALLSRHLSPGQDPVKLVALALSDAGYDVDGEVVEWADED